MWRSYLKAPQLHALLQHRPYKLAASNIRDNECSLQLIYYQTCIRLIQGSIEFIRRLRLWPCCRPALQITH